MTLKEFNDKVKTLKTDKEKQDFLDSMTQEELDVITNLIIEQHKIRFTFINDDFSDYTEDENEINERIINISDAIKSYNQDRLYYTKDSILNPYILRILAHCIKDVNRDLDEQRLNELIREYNRINDFINNNSDYDEIIKLYDDIVDKDDNGFYVVNDAMVDKIIKDYDLNVANDKEPVEEAIISTWENKKEIIKPSEINDLSIKNNGIDFKQFIFCEEYIKRGKIKPTCDYLGISRNTAYLWLKDDKVTSYLKDRQAEIKRETDDTFIQTYRASFNELNKMINSKSIETTDKIKAIDTFLKHYENIERLKTPVYED